MCVLVVMGPSFGGYVVRGVISFSIMVSDGFLLDHVIGCVAFDLRNSEAVWRAVFNKCVED